MSAVATAPRALTLQMLDWLAERPRTYGETMDAWRTSCPRLSIWEDALADRLVHVGRGYAGVGQSGSPVELTVDGQSLLDRFGQPQRSSGQRRRDGGSRSFSDRRRLQVQTFAPVEFASTELPGQRGDELPIH